MAAKKRASRKKANEADYKVTKSRSDAGATQTDDETISADNSADAAKQAMEKDPRAGRYDKVEIEKDGSGSGRVRTKPDTVSSVKPKTKGMARFESVTFPYNIGLPLGCKPLFESLTSKVKGDLTITTRYGRLHIQVPNAKVMEGVMSEFEKKARGKTEVKGMASMVVNGINESVKK